MDQLQLSTPPSSLCPTCLEEPRGQTTLWSDVETHQGLGRDAVIRNVSYCKEMDVLILPTILNRALVGMWSEWGNHHLQLLQTSWLWLGGRELQPVWETFTRFPPGGAPALWQEQRTLCWSVRCPCSSGRMGTEGLSERALWFQKYLGSNRYLWIHAMPAQFFIPLCGSVYSRWEQLRFLHIQVKLWVMHNFSWKQITRSRLWGLEFEHFSVQVFQDEMFHTDRLRWKLIS